MELWEDTQLYAHTPHFTIWFCLHGHITYTYLSLYWFIHQTTCEYLLCVGGIVPGAED